ncbi:uncharacterized protein LOC132734512 [Ruditapes philippinarum]|uniref:uncharacterized protein LOC132734512 n=1 Tax=Ruditapes philippinarum TaxID=129788 RepID=UPI00295B01DC|nr:uncharacterized protein LOC132734512 [Ruditapes philippinarum]
MPRKWVYTKRGKTQLYNKTSLDDAVNAVKEGMSIRQAAKHFNVPKSTIGDRISGKHELHVPNGRPPHIPKAIEDKIVDAVKMAARRGIGLTRQQVLNRTLVLTKRMKIGGGFPNFKAGKGWWDGVRRRHPDLVIRKPERLSSTRARMMNREVIGKYFVDLGRIIHDLNLTDKPSQIWNCDEMAKNFEHEPVRVVAAKGIFVLVKHPTNLVI